MKPEEKDLVERLLGNDDINDEDHDFLCSLENELDDYEKETLTELEQTYYGD